MVNAPAGVYNPQGYSGRGFHLVFRDYEVEMDLYAPQPCPSQRGRCLKQRTFCLF